MSRRELTRVEVLARVKAETLSLTTAAGMLGVSSARSSGCGAGIARPGRKVSNTGPWVNPPIAERPPGCGSGCWR